MRLNEGRRYTWISIPSDSATLLRSIHPSSLAVHHVPWVTKQVIDETISVFAACGRFLEQHSERRYHDSRIVEIYNGMAEIQPSNLVRISKKLNLDFLPAALFLEAEREGHCRSALAS